uniref:Bidirectional sugar transporter SWEET n=2 Tax=Hordeum vulgare subsp. vulgare TaxID=112509 RepID=A0A8I6Z3W9_HORVV
MEEQQVGFLDVLCWATAVIAPALSIPGMVKRWRQWTLGQGDRRPEPTVAALACGLAWCYYGHINDQAEPLRINAWGALVQAACLFTYLWLCTPEERKHALLSIIVAAGYVYTTFFIPYNDADDLKSMCTFAGLVSAAAPLLTFALLVDEWSIAMLPPWGMSCFSMPHSFAWCVRGRNKEDGHPAYAMVIPNGVGAVCSLVLLLLAWYWPPAPAAQGRDAPTTVINIDDLGVAPAAGLPPPAAQTHGVVRNRRVAATDDEARAMLINPGLVDVAKAAGTASVPPLPTQAEIQERERIAAEAQETRALLNQDLVGVSAGKTHEE